MKYKIVFFNFVIAFLTMGCSSALAHSPHTTTTIVYEYDEDYCYYYDCGDIYYETTVVVPSHRRFSTHRHSGNHYHKHYHSHYHKHKRYKKVKHKRYRKHKRYKKVNRKRHRTRHHHRHNHRHVHYR
jgi:hypothetical protein